MGILLNTLNYPIILQLQLTDNLPDICECNYIVLVQEGQHLFSSLISASQEIPYFLWNSKVYYHSVGQLSKLCRIMSIYSLPSHSCKTHFSINILGNLLPSGFLSKLFTNFPSFCKPTCHNLLDLTVKILYLEAYSSSKFLIAQFSPSICFFLPLMSKLLPQHQTPSVCTFGTGKFHAGFDDRFQAESGWN